MIEFIAVLGAMAGLAYEFWWERPKDRELRDVRLHAAVATLSAQPNVVAASHAVQRILELMHRDGVNMTGISIPNLTFIMAKFEEVDWSNALMNSVDFACPELDTFGRTYSNNLEWKPQPCAELAGARFLGTALSSVRFHRADISHAILYGARLSGVEAKEVDFSDARFVSENDPNYILGIFGSLPWPFRFRAPPSFLFNCDRGPEPDRCVELERVSFFRAHLPWAGFRGANIESTDFTNAKLKNATFGCEEGEDSQMPPCTVISNTCFSGARLEHAKFIGATIKNSDFRGAVLDNAKFNNVKLDKVVFDADVNLEAILDADSRKNLEEIAPDSRSTATACTANWRESLLSWELMPGRDRRGIPRGHPLLTPATVDHALSYPPLVISNGVPVTENSPLSQ
ncbi:MAG: pentapeptide repeat-containing protein [Rhodospirillales bacterium]|nr:pentapeptide repeat-containing protein [Rhodospirillales bacterium]